jgi:molecular chaperone DnaK (HSP70)
MTAEFQRQTGVDLRKDKMATQRLKEAAEKARSSCPRRQHQHQSAVHLDHRGGTRSTST